MSQAVRKTMLRRQPATSKNRGVWGMACTGHRPLPRSLWKHRGPIGAGTGAPSKGEACAARPYQSLSGSWACSLQGTRRAQPPDWGLRGQRGPPRPLVAVCGTALVLRVSDSHGDTLLCDVQQRLHGEWHSGKVT